MITTKMGEVCMVGSTAEICADISVILTEFRENITNNYGKDMAEDLVAKVVKTSAMTEEEVVTETQALKEKDINTASEIMKIIIKGMGE